MKYILIILTFFTANIYAQDLLHFNKKYVKCEDKWVAFEEDKDSSYAFGFIYIDSDAGLTLNYEGKFKIKETGEFIPEKLDTTSIKIRLTPNNVQVAFIPESKFDELEIERIPEWLKFYKEDTTSIDRLYKWGFMYNGWGECEKALTYLKKAYKINSKYNGLSTELAYSYNCLGEYKKSIKLLKTVLDESPNDPYVNKELIYSYIKSNQLEKASESCKSAIENCSDTTYNAENCYNLLYTFYSKQDKKNFILWLDETKKWTSNNDELSKGIKNMKNELLQ